MALVSNTTKLKIDTGKGLVYINNQKLYSVVKAPNSFHSRRTLYDASGNPIYTLYKKRFSLHERWEVYRGASKDPKDLVFSVKRKSIVQWGILKLKVFRASNTAETVCDFMVCAGFLKQSASILSVGTSKTLMAKMKKNFGGNYEVKVHPQFSDYLAFFATLIIILDKMSHIDKVSGTTFKIVRMLMDPFDVSGLLLEEFGETVAENIVGLLEEIIKDNNNGAICN